MRKLLVFGSILLLSLGLAGCDLIPTDIIDQVVEYNGVAEEVIDEKIQTFIKDLEDPEKSNDEICSTWFDGVDDDCNQFMEENRTKFKAGAELSKTVNILDPDSDDDGLLDATISFDYNGHVTVLKISFDLDTTTDDLQLKVVDSEVTFTPNSETVAQLDAFIEDLTNSNLSDDELCSVWYDGVDDDCDKFMEENRTKFKAGAELSKTVDFSDLDSDDDGLLDATVCCFDYNDHSTELKISFYLDNTTGDLQLKIVDSEVTFTPNRETVAQLDAFIEDLMNPDLSDAEVCRTWLKDEGIDNDCNRIMTETRTKFKAGAELSKTVNISYPDSDGDGFGELMVSLNDDGHVTVLKISFTEDYSSEELNLIITDVELMSDVGDEDCDDGQCPVRPDDALTFYQEYLDEYMDDSVSIETLKSYFETAPSEEYFALREQYLQEGTNIVLIDIIGPVAENTYIFVYDVINGDEASRKHLRGTIKSLDKASPLLMILDPDDDDDGILTAEEIDVLSSFKDDLNDEGIPIEDVCVKYFGQVDDVCSQLRDTEEGYIIGEIELLEFDDTNYIRIRKRPGRTVYSDVEINATYMVFFYHNDAGSILFDLVPAEYFDYDEELTKEFDQLLANLDDPTIPLDEVCLAVSTESYSKCDMLRKTVAGNDPSISKTEIVTVDGISMNKITVQYSMQDEVMEMMFYVSFVRDPESMRQVLEIIEVE